MTNLKNHFKESDKLVKDIIRKLERYHKLAEITEFLRLKKLNQFYVNKGLELGFAGLNLCLKDLDLAVTYYELRSNLKDV